ncbi:MAG: NAD(P)H-dependent oxidoreductase subunit E, partial [Candidatus Latescibacterota bacterium]
MELLIPVLTLTGISLFLGGLILLADRFLADYGECTIRVSGEKEFTVRGGQTLLSYLTAHDINVPSACGGKASCGYCKVKVMDGGGQILPTEKGFITPEERKNGMRLACQVKVKNDMDIIMPDYLETVRNIVHKRLYNPELKWKFRIVSHQYSEDKKKSPVKAIKLDTDHHEEIYKVIKTYRDMPGSTIPILQGISAIYNYLPEHALEIVSREMNIPYSTIYRVSTFYTAFSLKPRGRNLIRVCLGTSCYVKGGADILR